MVALLAATLAGTSKTAHAEPQAGMQYEGALSDGGRVSLVVSTDAKAVEAYFVFRNPPRGCPTQAYYARILHDEGGERFRVDRETSPFTVSPGKTMSVTTTAIGFWQISGFDAASGSLLVQPDPASQCAELDFSWRASRSDGKLRVGAGSGVAIAGARGYVYALGSTEPKGAVGASTNEFGTALQSFSFTFRDGDCVYDRSMTSPVYYDAGASLHYLDPSAFGVSAVGGADSISGGIVAWGRGACPMVALYYVARVPQATPTATPTTTAPTGELVLPPGIFVRSPEFDSTTFTAEAVFTGGPVDYLEIALFQWNARGAWVHDSGGERRYLEAGSFPAARDAFKAQFPNGITPMTTVTLVR